jgi:hypothetical protein
MEEGFELVYNEETGEWEKHEEPFAVIECKTEEEFELIQKALKFYKENYKGE